MLSQAVSLDPKYGKAWARLGKSAYVRFELLVPILPRTYFTHHVASHQELHLYDLSTKAWNEALGTLPSEGLSAQETQLKLQYQEGLRLSQEGLEARESRTMESNKLQAIPANVKPPWIVALEMEDVLTANNVLNSCVSALCPIPQARSHAST